MRKYNPNNPLISCGDKPIAIAFTNNFNIEVYEITDFEIRMAFDDKHSKWYAIQYTPDNRPYIGWRQIQIQLQHFIDKSITCMI